MVGIDERSFLSASDVATVVGCSRATAYRLIAAGIVPSVRLSQGRVRVPRAAFQAWIEMQNVNALAGTADHRSGGTP